MKDNINKKPKSELDNLKKQLEEIRKQNEEYKNDLIRLQADFENYIKRTNKEKENLKKIANGNFTKDGQVLVGEPARRQAVSNPEGTILKAKRKMGADFKYNIHGKEYTPQQ